MDETERIWALRLTAQAFEDIHAAWDYLAQTAGEEIADAWQQGLEAAIATLARMPERQPIAEESVLFTETVRKFVYRRSPGGPAYRVLFVLRTPVEDAPIVAILHIRHGARSPMTPGEARQMEAEQ